jgi:hypothetical protein
MIGFYAYIYIDPSTGMPLYVGKGCRDRISTHLNNNNNNLRLNRKIKKMQRVGLEPLITYIPTRDEKQAFEFERLLIAMWGRADLSDGPLYNLTNGGEGNAGRQVTESTRQKLRDSLTIGARTRGMHGRRHSAATRRRMSIVATGRKQTPEHTANHAAALMGRRDDPQSRRNKSRAATAAWARRKEQIQ